MRHVKTLTFPDAAQAQARLQAIGARFQGATADGRAHNYWCAQHRAWAQVSRNAQGVVVAFYVTDGGSCPC